VIPAAAVEGELRFQPVWQNLAAGAELGGEAAPQVFQCAAIDLSHRQQVEDAHQAPTGVFFQPYRFSLL